MDENKEKKFISERILGREMTLRRAVRWILLSLVCGIVFGLTVFGVNYLAGSAAEKAEKSRQEAKEQISSEATETDPKTEESLPQAAEPDTSVRETETAKEPTTAKEQETEKESETELESKSGEDTGKDTGETEEGETGEDETEESLIDPELLHRSLLSEREAYPYGTEELKLVLNAEADACENISGYIARVSNTISAVTWFESTVETQRNYSGIVVSVSESEILILTVANAVTDGGSLSVTFHDGTRNEAVVKKVSDRDGLCVIAVSTEGLGIDFVEKLVPVETVSEEGIRTGMPVITAGSPMGTVGSYGFGNINFVAEPESVEDGRLLCCYSEASSDPEEGTFLMSVDGKLLGLAAARKENSEVTGNRFIVADSCRNLIESLKKGNDMARLGITGIDISFDMRYKNVPEGMYVTAVNEDGPAFAAGLRRGDIVAMIGAREIKGISDYLNFMRNLRPGETVTVTILRESGRSEYKEMELQMTAGIR